MEGAILVCLSAIFCILANMLFIKRMAVSENEIAQLVQQLTRIADTLEMKAKTNEQNQYLMKERAK